MHPRSGHYNGVHFTTKKKSTRRLLTNQGAVFLGANLKMARWEGCDFCQRWFHKKCVKATMKKFPLPLFAHYLLYM